jgi:hypothetical protein
MVALIRLPVGYRVYTSRFELMRKSKSPNPLGKGAKIRILVPLFKGDLAAVLFWGSPRIKNRQDRGIFRVFAAINPLNCDNIA